MLACCLLAQVIDQILYPTRLVPNNTNPSIKTAMAANPCKRLTTHFPKVEPAPPAAPSARRLTSKEPIASKATVIPVPRPMAKAETTPAVNMPCESENTRTSTAPVHGRKPMDNTADQARAQFRRPASISGGGTCA